MPKKSYSKKDYEESIKWLAISAYKGNSEAQFDLGLMYYQGIGTDTNYKIARQWLEKASMNGNTKADFYLGKMYFIGADVKKSHVKAFNLFLKSATHNFPSAQYFVGSSFENGYGIKKDHVKAFEWYLKASKNNDLKSQQKVAKFYYSGIGINKNIERSLKWATKAGDRGDKESMVLAGKIYYESQKYTNAMFWFNMAIEYDRFLSEPLYYIGKMYLNGEGVKKNLEKAFNILNKSSSFGFSAAQYLLARMYNFGIGTIQNFEKAESLYRQSLAQGNQKAKKMLVKLYEFMGDRSYYGEYFIPEELNKGCADKVGTSESDCFLVYWDKQICDKFQSLETTKHHKDESEAIKFYKKALLLDKKNIKSPLMLGKIFDNLNNLNTINKIEAAKYFEIAAINGSIEAMFNIADMYEHGEGVHKNIDTALIYYKRLVNSINYGKFYKKAKKIVKVYEDNILKNMQTDIFQANQIMSGFINSKKKPKPQLYYQVGNLSSKNRSIKFSPCGKFILAGNVEDISFSKVGRFAISIHSLADMTILDKFNNFVYDYKDSNTLTLWDVDTGKELKKFSQQLPLPENNNFNYVLKYINSYLVNIRHSKVEDEKGNIIYRYSKQNFRKHITEKVRSTFSKNCFSRLWDINSGKELFCFGGSARFLKNGKIIRYEYIENSLYIISEDNYYHIGNRREDSFFEELVFSDDDEYFATKEKDVFKIWNIQTGKEIQKIEKPTMLRVNERSMNLRPYEYNDSLYDFENKDNNNSYETVDISKYKYQRKSLCFSPSNKSLLSYYSFSEDILKINIIIGWDIKTGNINHAVLLGMDDEILLAKISPDGKFFYMNTPSFSRLRNFETGSVVKNLDFYRDESDGCAFSPDSSKLAIGNPDKSISLYNMEFNKNSSLGFEPFKNIYGRPVYPSNAYFFSSTSKKEKGILTAGKGNYSPIMLKFSKHYDYNLNNHVLSIWDFKKSKKISSLISEHVEQFTYNHHLNLVAFLNGENELKLFDYESNKLLKTWNFKDHTINDIQVSTNGKYVIVVGDFSMFKVLSVEQDTEILPDVRISRTGNTHLIVKGSDGYISTKEYFTVPIYKAIFSKNGQYVAVGTDLGSGNIIEKTSNTIIDKGPTLYLYKFEKSKLTFINKNNFWETDTSNSSKYGSIHAISFSPDSKQIASGSENGILSIYEVETGKEIGLFDTKSYITDIKYTSDNRYLITGHLDNSIRLWDLNFKQQIKRFEGHSAAIHSLDISNDNKLLLSVSDDGTIRIWDIQKELLKLSFVNFENSEWVVIDNKGRFDASNIETNLGLHWVYKTFIIELNQLKYRYYEPNLLSKIMGYNDEPLRPVEKFENPKLFPKITLFKPDIDKPKFNILIENQEDGGIGRVQVFVENKEIISDLITSNKAKFIERNEDKILISIDLSDCPFLVSGEKNNIKVVAWNEENYLSFSRGSNIEAPGEKTNCIPSLYAVISGVSKYSAKKLNLDFAGKDAANFATALSIAGNRLFGKDRVHLHLFTDYQNNLKIGKIPRKECIKEAFYDIAKNAKHCDILVVFLAGHGCMYKPNKEYHYLTMEANTYDLSDSEIRKFATISNSELKEWIKNIQAKKQVLVLDTCAAGAYSTKTRFLSSSQKRALDRLKDRTGVFILMGAAKNKSSLEAPFFNQGLLTHSLLEGMKGAALREDQLIDVSMLFSYAIDRVPNIAKLFHNMQQPEYILPQNGKSFDIGQVNNEDKELIPLSEPLPMVQKSAFEVDSIKIGACIDELDITNKVNEYYRTLRQSNNKYSFIEKTNMPDAYKLKGIYRINKKKIIRFDLFIIKNNKVIEKYQKKFPSKHLDKKIETIVRDSINKIINHFNSNKENRA